MDNKSNTMTEEQTDQFKLKAGIFLAVVSGISAVVGFNVTLAAARKHDTKYFDKGIADATRLETTGASLALRALGWGTLYAVCGTGILTYGIWKLSGAEDFKDFRYRMGKILPRISKEPSGERTEFSGLSDLLEYISKK